MTSMTQIEINAILNVHLRAFSEADGAAEGQAIAALAATLLEHPEVISVSAERDGKIAGNVLFTPFTFTDHPEAKCQLLAPCAVAPEYQGRGVGRELMESSIAQLRALGTNAVFVLGVPTFYPRYGFVPTDKETPYPDLLTMPEAWMALELTDGTLARLGGRTRAIPQFMQAHFWDTSMHD